MKKTIPEINLPFNPNRKYKSGWTINNDYIELPNKYDFNHSSTSYKQAPVKHPAKPSSSCEIYYDSYQKKYLDRRGVSNNGIEYEFLKVLNGAPLPTKNTFIFKWLYDENAYNISQFDESRVESVMDFSDLKAVFDILTHIRNYDPKSKLSYYTYISVLVGLFPCVILVIISILSGILQNWMIFVIGLFPVVGFGL